MDTEPDTANGTKMVEWIKWKMEQKRHVYQPIEPLDDSPLDYVFRDPSIKDRDEYRVFFDLKIQRPSFNSKEAAVAFLKGLIDGNRKQEL